MMIIEELKKLTTFWDLYQKLSSRSKTVFVKRVVIGQLPNLTKSIEKKSSLDFFDMQNIREIYEFLDLKENLVNKKPRSLLIMTGGYFSSYINGLSWLIKNYQAKDLQLSPEIFNFNHNTLSYLHGHNRQQYSKHQEYLDDVRYMLAREWLIQNRRDYLFEFFYENDDNDWFCNLRTLLDGKAFLPGMGGELMSICPDEHKTMTRQYILAHTENTQGTR